MLLRLNSFLSKLTQLFLKSVDPMPLGISLWGLSSSPHTVPRTKNHIKGLVDSCGGNKPAAGYEAPIRLNASSFLATLGFMPPDKDDSPDTRIQNYVFLLYLKNRLRDVLTSHPFGGDLHARANRLSGSYGTAVNSTPAPPPIELLGQLDKVANKYYSDLRELSPIDLMRQVNTKVVGDALVKVVFGNIGQEHAQEHENPSTPAPQ